MRIKTLFSIPAGEKVTEKALRRVLLSSICGILLCMTCLVGTTWAWFTVSIENTGNVIEIGTPEVNLAVNGSDFQSGKQLRAGENEILIEHANELDDLQRKSKLYVAFSVGNEVLGYVILDSSNGYKTGITMQTDKKYPLSWTASWFAPDTAPLTESVIHWADEETVAPAVTTAATEPHE